MRFSVRGCDERWLCGSSWAFMNNMRRVNRIRVQRTALYEKLKCLNKQTYSMSSCINGLVKSRILSFRACSRESFNVLREFG